MEYIQDEQAEDKKSKGGKYIMVKMEQRVFHIDKWMHGKDWNWDEEVFATIERGNNMNPINEHGHES